MYELHVPTFHRLSDYIGAWMVEANTFQTHWDMVQRMDLAAHLRQEVLPLKSQTELVPSKNGGSVAIVPLTGLLMKAKSSFGGTSTVQARRDVRSAANDPTVSAILLGIDSPGGTAAGTDDLAAEVRNARKAKPVWAFVDDLGASAAYWVASQADKIFANSATALVGSIGTIMTIYDVSQSAEQNGVKALVFATGPLKGAGVTGTKVTDEQQAYFQGIVNSLQTEFDAGVKRGRKLSDKQLASVRTGGVWTAAAAQSLGLIDGVQTLAKTIADLSATAGSGRPTRSRTSALFDLARQPGVQVDDLEAIEELVGK